MQKHTGLSKLATYFYPIMIFYKTHVVYDVKSRKDLMSMYSKKLLSLISLSNRGTKKLTNLRLEIDSVTIRVLLDKEKLGTIADVSMNYSEYLGESQRGTFIGKNLNDFFPGRFKNKH